jgi:hypothetical protein
MVRTSALSDFCFLSALEDFMVFFLQVLRADAAGHTHVQISQRYHSPQPQVLAVSLLQVPTLAQLG